MEISQKRTLLTITYFACIALVVIYGVALGMFLGTRLNVLWAQIAYFIWLGLIVLNVAFDIVATFMGNYKFIAGLILAGITVVTVGASIGLFITLAPNGVLAAGSVYPFLASVLLSYLINALAIVIFVNGERFAKSLNY